MLEFTMHLNVRLVWGWWVAPPNQRWIRNNRDHNVFPQLEGR